MRLSYRLTSLLFVLLIPVLFSCKGDKGAMPKTAVERIDHFASKAPANAESLVVVPDVEDFRAKLSSLKGRVAESGLVEGLQKSVQQMFGVDVLDAESWKAAGLTPKSSIGVVVHKSRPVMMMYVDNRQAFEKVLIERTKAAFNVEAVTKQETVGKHKVKVLSEDPAKQIAWVYEGKLALVAMPALSDAGAIEEGSAALVVTSVLDTKKETSLLSTPQFAKFKKEVIGKGTFAMYTNVEGYLQSREVQERLKEDPNSERAVGFIKKNIDYFAAYGDFVGDRLTVKLMVSGKEAFNAIAQEVAKIDTSGKWEGFVTDKIGVGVRLSIDPKKALDFALTAMNEEEQRAFKRNMKLQGERMGLDLEEDVIKGMTGHVGLFFYGIAGNDPMVALQAARDPASLASKLGLLGAIRFKNRGAVDNLLAKLLASSEGFSLAPLMVGGEELADFKALNIPLPDVPIRIFAHNDTILLSTNAFGDEAIHGYLSGTRDKDKKIGDVEGMELGKEFATSNQYNGIYAHAERLSENPGQLLRMVGAGALIDVFQEAQLKVGADETGASITFLADVDEAKPATAGGDNKPTIEKVADDRPTPIPAPKKAIEKSDDAPKK